MKNIIVLGSPATIDVFDTKINPYYNQEYNINVFSKFISLASFNSETLLVDTKTKWIKDEIKLSYTDVPLKNKTVIFDVLADVIFGWIEIAEGKLTNNVWQDKTYLNELKKRGDLIFFGTDREKFLTKLKLELTLLIENFKKQEPDMSFIYNSIRYPLKMTKEQLNVQDLSADYPKKVWINDVNSILFEIEKMILKNFTEIKVMHFDSNASHSEYHHTSGRNSFYYNEAYYLEKLIEIEQILMLKKIKHITTAEEITKKYDFYDYVIVENLFDQVNLLSACWHNEPARILANKLASQDFILDGAFGRQHRFIKRSEFYRAHLKKMNNIWYSEEIPTGKQSSGSNKKKILFMFMPLPGKEGMLSPNMERRALPHMFGSLNKSLVKDTHIIRIADLNLMRGSFYVDTDNYPTFETDLKNFINTQIEEKGSQTKSVLYGASRGGVGALLYSTYLNIKAVAVDPVIDETPYIEEQHDFHLVKGVREISLGTKFEKAANMVTGEDIERLLIGNSYVKQTWSTNKLLKKAFESKLTLYDLGDETIIKHPQVTFESIPLQLMFINKFLVF